MFITTLFNMGKFLGLLSLFLLFNLVSCSEKEEIVEQVVEPDVFLGVGKWKIKKRTISSGKAEDCNLTDLILNSDLSFKIYFENNNVIVGRYELLDDESINLIGSEGSIGSLTNIKVEDSTISFDIDLTGICQNSLEGEKDETYVESKTFIADVEFEKYLIEQGWDTVLDNYVTTSSINTIRFISINERNITSLVGIEDFDNLEGLDAANNQISGVLDLSLNIKLVNVVIPFNPIQALYLKNNLALENVWIYETQTLEDIEITNSPKLSTLTLHNNKLTELDLSGSPNIYNLRIWDSKLSTLDLRFMSKLEYLVAWDVFNDSNEGEIFLPEQSSLKVMALGYNRLQNIDLSSSIKIERLDLDGNQLSTIDFSQNPSLEYLAVAGNLLERLDLSPITNLYLLRAYNNFIDCIQLNENQINAIPPSCVDLNIPDFVEEEEGVESCYNTGAWIEEDFFPRGYQITSTWVVDEGTVFSTNCN